jgi:hypothetical protein
MRTSIAAASQIRDMATTRPGELASVLAHGLLVQALMFGISFGRNYVGRIMVQRLRMFVLFAGVAIGAAQPFQASAQSTRGQSAEDHVAWVAQGLKRMQTIKPGMTRQALLTAFTTEGGLSTGLQRTFVSRDCPYFKVDVEFQAVGRPNRDGNGRVTLVEDGQDIILKISRPYLQFTIAD